MDTVLIEWLASIGWRAFTWALAGLLLLNGAAGIWFVLQGTREAVQRWTPIWLAGNLLLVAVGVGVPTVTSIARLAVMGAQRVVPVGIMTMANAPAGETR